MFITIDSNEFQPIDEEIGGEEITVFQKMGNQRFTKIFRYDIWGECMSILASKIHLKNTYAD